MKRSLTKMKELVTIPLVGQTQASNAEEQLARDNQSNATNCRWGGSLLPSHFTIRQDNSELCNALKKPNKNSPPKAVSLCAKGKKSLKTMKWICPIHAEPIQWIFQKH
jgi:hypothetical protein